MTPTLNDLLQQVSRTFALSIPRLPQPTQQEATVAYLLMRIADTFEDTTDAPLATRSAGLSAFCALMRSPADPAARARLQGAGEGLAAIDAGERATLQAAPQILDALLCLRPKAQAIIAQTCEEMAAGMQSWIEAPGQAGGLTLRSLQELRDYCHVVAGIVGRMLTDLYLLQCPQLREQAGGLHGRALAFGEGVQLVNILKDVKADAAQRRQFLPPELPLREIFDLAWEDLDHAQDYLALLKGGGACPGIVAFNQITLELGQHALRVTEAQGSGAKIPRGVVRGILAAAPQ